jgi:2-polyprenyl-6-methoxyphenol hydroxylase-like FAD-dependent oxidoreductase
VLLRAIDRQRYHFGHVFERVEQDGSGVWVRFANGCSERADLLVACDGFRSTVRAQLAPEVRRATPVTTYGVARPTSAISSLTRTTVYPYFSFFLADQLQVLGYPISGVDDELRPGHRRYNFGWYRVANAQQLTALCTDDNGQQHAFSVPSPLVRRELIAQMRDETHRLLPPQFLDCLEHIDQPFFTPVYDFCSTSSVFGRVALVGDAGSTPRPHVGFGVSKAGAEAQALAEGRLCRARRACPDYGCGLRRIGVVSTGVAPGSTRLGAPAVQPLACQTTPRHAQVRDPSKRELRARQ